MSLLEATQPASCTPYSCPNSAASVQNAGSPDLRAAVAAATLDLLPLPTWVCRANGNVVYANAAARQAPAHTLWPHVQGDKVASADPADATALADALQWAAQGSRGALALRLGGAVARQSGPEHGRAAVPPAILRVAPMGDDPHLKAVWPQDAALLMLEWPSVPLDEPLAVKRIEHRYGLSPSESAVLSHLVKGHKVADIARQRSIREATVRSQLRSIFDKTALRRQADLVRLVACG